ncbi:MAG TPA: pyrroloquinoline quinone biosynthesis protein PqqE [bacterium]|jgi:pyrroloquinoline quinone biosynthesis protein E|nr:pyrroloquinoline quinone biosynthesis protein PqqE [bacterium]
MDESLSPRLAARTKLQKDPATGRWVLLFPEGLMNLNESAAAILGLCDGGRNWREILEKLSALFKTPVFLLEGDVRDILQKLESKGLVEWVEAVASIESFEQSRIPQPAGHIDPMEFRPLGLLAELTYRCPLHCPYCSNPVWDEKTGKGGELTTGKWKKVLSEARDLGVLHALFSGGEPLQRPDLEELVAHAHGLGLYTNLITSGLGLSDKRTLALKEAGLDSVQLSFQAAEESLADEIAGTKAHAKKLETARIVRSLGLPLTVNIVLHRANIDRLEALITLAEQLGAHRLELANTQYYGWAFRNRPKLLPTREQVLASSHVAEKARARLKGKMEILYVIPDYFYDRPKPCMNGWGRRYITVNPSGQVLPCPTAYSIASLKLENVREKPLAWIWKESESFNRFRGTQWMPEPCASCDLKEVDFGGCRCQAALLTGDPTLTDPACGLSPNRSKLEEALAEGLNISGKWDYRQNP